MKTQLIALFPGQGSQHVGMAKDLVNQFKIARQAFEEASDAVRIDLRKLCFEGPESDLTLTANTQPALLTASVAAFRVAQSELGFAPAAVAGHSLGEYSALVAAGALSLGTAAHWVHERGASMQQAVPAGQGTMAAILSMEDEVVERLCVRATELAQAKRASGERTDVSVECIVQPANYNAPGQLVIAGSTDAVEEAVALVKAGVEFGKGKAIPLSVSAPFHCRLMGATRERMAELFGTATSLQKPKSLACPYIPNRTARLTQETGIILELLVEQVDHTVLWKHSIQTFLDSGFTTGLEFGPGKVLQGLAKRIQTSTGATLALTSFGDPSALSVLESMLTAEMRQTVGQGA